MHCQVYVLGSLGDEAALHPSQGRARASVANVRVLPKRRHGRSVRDERLARPSRSEASEWGVAGHLPPEVLRCRSLRGGIGDLR